MAKVTGGQKLAVALTTIGAKLSKPGTLRIGFLEGATYPNGTSVPMVAAIQEFGAPRVGIPPRPFFRTMIAAKSPGWPAAIAEQLRETNYDVGVTLNRIGDGIGGQLQESILDLHSPALSPVTVMLRGMKSADQSLVVTRGTVAEARRRVAAGLTNYGADDKPLIESGHLSNSVAHEVKK